MLSIFQECRIVFVVVVCFFLEKNKVRYKSLASLVTKEMLFKNKT